MKSQKILSIDVGIKNLAYCILEINETFKIISWDIINILDDKIDKQPKCENIINNKICNKISSFKFNINDSFKFYCDKKTCHKKMNKKFPNIKLIKQKKITVKNTPLIELVTILLNKLKINNLLLNVDIVIIENQPVLKNPTMKSIQIVLYTYFIENGIINNNSLIKNVILFSARNKLKGYNGPIINTDHIKNKYNKRKYLSIEYTKYYIKNSKFYNFFINSKKKDDLADSFIQGYYYSKKHLKCV